MKNLKQFGEPLSKDQMKQVRGGKLPCGYIYTIDNCPGGSSITVGCGLGGNYYDEDCSSTPQYAQLMYDMGCSVSVSSYQCA